MKTVAEIFKETLESGEGFKDLLESAYILGTVNADKKSDWEFPVFDVVFGDRSKASFITETENIVIH